MIPTPRPGPQQRRIAHRGQILRAHVAEFERGPNGIDRLHRGTPGEGDGQHILHHYRMMSPYPSLQHCGDRPSASIIVSLKSKPERDKYVRLFILESPGPLDAIEGRSEGPAIAHLAKLIGHEVLSFSVHSQDQFEECCRYIGTIADYRDDRKDRPICVHISAHGDQQNNAVALGGDGVSYEQLVDFLRPICHKRLNRPIILVISACYADEQRMTRVIEKVLSKPTDNELVPPKYVFCSTSSVAWSDAAVGWALFYHLLPDVNLDKKNEVIEMLRKIKSIDLVTLKYWRWESSELQYRTYEAK